MGRKGVTSQGRRKIEIKKIQSEDARHVCFSKRKAGIFAKASDISTLCGADVALVVYSPAGNPYSFGSPAVEPIVDRFLSGNLIRSGSGPDASRSGVVQQLNQQYMELSKQLEASKARKVKLQERLAMSVRCQEIEWAKNIDGLGLVELNRVKDGFERLKSKADARIKEILGADQRMMLPGIGVALGCGGGSSAAGTYPVWAFNSMQVPNQVEAGPFQTLELAAGSSMGYMNEPQ